MRHIVMRLPEEKNAEYIYMVPFTPRGKDNLAAWMAARNDGAEYGRLRVYRLSRQSLAFGPQQIVNRINQNTEVSQQLTLWDQRGSQVIRGDLLVIPIEEALMYVQPIYLRARGRADPRAQAGGGGVSEPGGDAGDAGGRAGGDVRGSRESRVKSRETNDVAADTSGADVPRLVTRDSRLSSAKRSSTTKRPSRPSGTWTGPATARRCASWARSSTG